MKRKTKVKPPIKTAERERLENLINLAIERYRLEDIVSAFIEATDNWQDRSTVVKGLLESEGYKDEIKSEVEYEITQGKFLIEANTLADQMKIQDFLCSEIFPYYNQQQTQLFA